MSTAERLGAWWWIARHPVKSWAIRRWLTDPTQESQESEESQESQMSEQTTPRAVQEAARGVAFSDALRRADALERFEHGGPHPDDHTRAVSVPSVDDVAAIICGANSRHLNSAGLAFECRFCADCLTKAEQVAALYSTGRAAGLALAQELADGERVRVIRTEQSVLEGVLRLNDTSAGEPVAPFALLSDDGWWHRLHVDGTTDSNDVIRDRFERQEGPDE